MLSVNDHRYLNFDMGQATRSAANILQSQWYVIDDNQGHSQLQKTSNLKGAINASSSKRYHNKYREKENRTPWRLKASQTSVMEDAALQKAESVRERWNGFTIPEGQGARHLRQTVVMEMKQTQSFSGLAPKALRARRQTNEELFSILRAKRVGHAFSLGGKAELPSGKKVILESFNDTLSLPMLADSVGSWAATKANEQEKNRACNFGKIFSSAIFHDKLSDQEVNRVLRDFYVGNIPILVGGGWDWHSIQIILFQDYIIFCNRGGGSNSGGSVPGWNVFKIGNKEIITNKWLKNLANRMVHTSSDYPSCQKITKELNAKLVFQHRMKPQRVGNCTYTSFKTAIAALMALWEASGGFTEQLTDESFLQLSKDWMESYKDFSNADRQLVLRDVAIDLKKQLRSKGRRKVDMSAMTLIWLIYKKLIASPHLVYLRLAFYALKFGPSQHRNELHFFAQLNQRFCLHPYSKTKNASGSIAPLISIICI